MRFSLQPCRNIILTGYSTERERERRLTHVYIPAFINPGALAESEGGLFYAQLSSPYILAAAACPRLHYETIFISGMDYYHFSYLHREELARYPPASSLFLIFFLFFAERAVSVLLYKSPKERQRKTLDLDPGIIPEFGKSSYYVCSCCCCCGYI